MIVHVALYLGLLAPEVAAAGDRAHKVHSRVHASHVQREASQLVANAQCFHLRCRVPDDGKELQDAPGRVMGVRDALEELRVDGVQACDLLDVENCDEPAVHLAHKHRGGGDLQAPPQLLFALPQVRSPTDGLQPEQLRQVGELRQAEAEGLAHEVLVQDQRVLPLLREVLHLLVLRGEEPGHGARHDERAWRYAVPPGQGGEGARGEGHGVADEALARRDVQHQLLHHAQAERALHRCAPALEVLDQGEEDVNGLDRLALLVQVHEITHLCLGI
mmetsp:Transcript_39188/g.122185  ORF Transcript_39188/g.122185 Transcript_39188/m.122185 type:complete len:275 (-) Transcript_39188:239-1063(-)